MSKAVKAGVVLGACLSVYFLVYPMILLVFAPYPDGDVARIKARLKMVVQASKFYCDDGRANDLSAQQLIDAGYVEEETFENAIAVIALGENATCDDLGTSRVVAQSDVLSAVNPPPMFPWPVRGWPSKRVPARRVVVKGNGVTEVRGHDGS